MKKKKKPQADAMLSHWLNPTAPKVRLGLPESTIPSMGAPDAADAPKSLAEQQKSRFLNSIERYANALADTVERAKRKSTLQELATFFLAEDGAPTEPLDAETIACLVRLLKPLLKRSADQVEVCRDLSIRICTRYVLAETHGV